jgi:hypothetical protein
MDLRGVEYHHKVTAPEAKALVKSSLTQNQGVGPWVVYDPVDHVSSTEIRDLMWRMFNMFRALFCTIPSLNIKKLTNFCSLMG